MNDAAANTFQVGAGREGFCSFFVLRNPGRTQMHSLWSHRPDTGAGPQVRRNADAPWLGTDSGPETLLVEAHFGVNGIGAQVSKALSNFRPARGKNLMGRHDTQSGGSPIEAQIPSGVSGQKASDSISRHSLGPAANLPEKAVKKFDRAKGD